MPLIAVKFSARIVVLHLTVHDLFLISFSDGSSQNTITHEKPYKITLGVRFFGVANGMEQSCTCNGCNAVGSALPDMYARGLRASAYISGNARLTVLQLICYTSK